MELKLYKTLDGDNVINKALTNVVTLEIVLRSNFDISAPELTLRQNGGLDISQFNYCVIPDLERCYFIRDVIPVGGNAVKIVCECDTLETYKADIMASTIRYRRKIKAGDYAEFNIGKSSKASISTHASNETIVDGETLILTSVGKGAN